MTIAGHTFDSRDWCSCGRSWLHIHHVDETYVGETGYAHVGALNGRECTEIVQEKARRDALHHAAFTGRSIPVDKPADTEWVEF